MTAAAREGRTLEKSPVLHGETCSTHLIPLSHCYSPKKEVCKLSALEGYFLCGDKSLLFTSCLGTNPIQQAASPGPHLTCSVQGCSHQEGSSGVTRRSRLMGESCNEKKTWLLSWLHMINLPPFLHPDPLYSEATDERIFIEVTPSVLSKDGIPKSI